MNRRCAILFLCRVKKVCPGKKAEVKKFLTARCPALSEAEFEAEWAAC